MKPGLVVLLFVSSALASDSIKMGTFSAATEADWGAAFELKSSGEAIITPHHESGSSNKKTIKGRWKESSGGIELTYSTFKDQFKLQKVCQGWEVYPCFRYEKSMTQNKNKSPLNLDFPYINWDWKK